MRISHNPAKRAGTLAERNLDFEDAADVFADPLQQTIEDAREDYGEPRFVTTGYWRGRLVVLVWTPRGDDERRIISMRKANAREQKRFGSQVGAARRDDR